MSSQANTHNSTDPVEMWKDWNETTTKMWVRTFDSGKDIIYRDPFGLYRFWMKPFMCFNQWDATSGIWARMFGEVMSSEQLLEANYQLIETYIHMIRNASHLVNEMMFPHRRLPTHPDSAQVAKLVVSLEERIYAIEDALVPVKDSDLNVVAPGQVGEELAGHLECVEGKQDTSDTLSSILQQTEVIGDLAGRMERVEGKLDMLLAVLEKLEARTYPETAWSSDGS